MMLGNAIHNRARKISCEQCSVPFIPHNKVLSLPLDRDTKQVQKFLIAVQEEVSWHSTTYKVVGAVQMRPGLFYSIVQDGGSFALLNDLNPTVKQYPTFGSAVNKKIVTTGTSTTCNLSWCHDGVRFIPKNISTHATPRCALTPVAE